MKRIFILFCLLLACAYCFSQSNNNEDEVVKIDWFNQHATKEGELIVKFADHTILQLQNDARGALQATGIGKVDALLQQYPVAKAERLCPNDDPKRELKTSKSYNGPDVVERDLSRLCRFVMEDPMQTYEMIDALKALLRLNLPNRTIWLLHWVRKRTQCLICLLCLPVAKATAMVAILTRVPIWLSQCIPCNGASLLCICLNSGLLTR